MLRILFEEMLSEEEMKERLCAIGLKEVADALEEKEDDMYWGVDDYIREEYLKREKRKSKMEGISIGEARGISIGEAKGEARATIKLRYQQLMKLQRMGQDKAYIESFLEFPIPTIISQYQKYFSSEHKEQEER